VNNNSYQLDLLEEYRFHASFNVIDLIPFAVSTNDEVDVLDLRINPLEKGGDDGRAPNKGPTTRGKWLGEFKRSETQQRLTKRSSYIFGP